jgi:hypothetical protein
MLTEKQKRNYDYRVEENDIVLIVSFYEFNDVKKYEKANQTKMIL